MLFEIDILVDFVIEGKVEGSGDEISGSVINSSGLKNLLSFIWFLKRKMYVLNLNCIILHNSVITSCRYSTECKVV